MITLNTNIEKKYWSKNDKLRQLYHLKQNPQFKYEIPLTLVDVIDNADYLFGDNPCDICEYKDFHKKGLARSYDDPCSGCPRKRNRSKGEYKSIKIIEMCQNDKTLQEIEDYILQELKIY